MEQSLPEAPPTPNFLILTLIALGILFLLGSFQESFGGKNST